MQPNQQLGFGSGSPMIGQGGQVAQQMANGAPALNQMGANAPGMVPGQQMAPAPGSMPQPSNAMPPSIMPMGGPGMPPGQPQKNQQPQIPKSEQQLIIEALTNHLKSKADMEKMRHEMAQHALGMPPKGV